MLRYNSQSLKKGNNFPVGNYKKMNEMKEKFENDRSLMQKSFMKNNAITSKKMTAIVNERNELLKKVEKNETDLKLKTQEIEDYKNNYNKEKSTWDELSKKNREESEKLKVLIKNMYAHYNNQSTNTALNKNKHKKKLKDETKDSEISSAEESGEEETKKPKRRTKKSKKISNEDILNYLDD